MIRIRLNTSNDVKPFKTIDQQLDLLESRGLIIPDRNNAAAILERTSYYRFSAYSLTLRDYDSFHNGVTFDNVYELYRFDDAFRKIVLAYTSYVEIAFRAHIAYEHGQKYGPLSYMQPSNFNNVARHQKFIEKLSNEIGRSDDAFVHHHREDRNCVFPIWVALECSSFGELSKMYKNMMDKDKTNIAKKYYGRSRSYIENWLQVCVYARNIAAHGGRFYNRKLRSVPLRIPKKLKDQIDRETPFAAIFAIHKLQPTTELTQSLRSEIEGVFKKYPSAELKHMGFPENWIRILIESQTSYADLKKTKEIR